MNNHAGKIDSVKFIDYENGDDDDTDSLASALSDYNTVFYDAPSIEEPKTLSSSLGESSNFATSNFCINSIDTSLNEPSDDDSFIMDEENDMFDSNEEELIRKEFDEFLNEEDETFEEEKRLKIKKIESVDLNFENYEEIRQLAIGKYGFVNKKLRQKAWPILILYKNGSMSQPKNIIDSSLKIYDSLTQSQIKNSKYYNQVTLDVVRTLKRFPPEISDKLRHKLQDQLIDIICKILIKHENLHYYQGYHDICITFLLVSGVSNCIPLLEHITLTHLTSYMESTMESTLKLLLNIMPLIDTINSQVSEHIQRAELGVIFGLSWQITWYSHVMDNLSIILRLYDFFIASHPLMPVYLGAVMVSDQAETILEIDCDMASLHTVITKIPSNINNTEQIENYIKLALELFEAYPPDNLEELNQRWLNKCKKIQQEEENKRIKEEEFYLRQRYKKDKYSNDLQANKNNRIIQKKNFSLIRLKESRLKPNKLLFGLTFTVGVAAVAMFALNTNGIKETPDLMSKFYQFLTLKDF